MPDGGEFSEFIPETQSALDQDPHSVPITGCVREIPQLYSTCHQPSQVQVLLKLGLPRGYCHCFARWKMWFSMCILMCAVEFKTKSGTRRRSAGTEGRKITWHSDAEPVSHLIPGSPLRGSNCMLEIQPSWCPLLSRADMTGNSSVFWMLV